MGAGKKTALAKCRLLSVRSVSTSTVEVAKDGHGYSFDPITLRDSCECAQCVDPSSGQKLFETAAIPADIEGRVETLSTMGSTHLAIAWTPDIQGYPDSHRTYVRKSEADRVDNHAAALPKTSWDAESFAKNINWISYESYMTDEITLYSVLDSLRRYGLVFLRGVPDLDVAVERIGGRIGALRNSFYGQTWQVKSMPSAKNIAYTQRYLGFHMDLL